MKNIAIMGARGFVGKNLVEYLEERYCIYPITRDDFSFLDEYAIKNFISKNNIDIIINCANEGGSRKSLEKTDIISNNLKMFFNIERCLEEDVRLINFGSGAQYDKQRDLVKVKEEQFDEFIPKDDYGYSKYLISKYLKDKPNIYNPIIFGLFGKYEDYTFKFISNAIIKNILDMPIIINQNVIFDYLCLNDFLEIMKKAIDNSNFKHNEFNITPTKSIDLLSVVDIINNCSKHKSQIIVKNAGLNYQYTGDNSRLLENLENFSFTTYENAIGELYKYYYENIDIINIEMIKSDKYIGLCETK